MTTLYLEKIGEFFYVHSSDVKWGGSYGWTSKMQFAICEEWAKKLFPDAKDMANHDLLEIQVGSNGVMWVHG